VWIGGGAGRSLACAGGNIVGHCGWFGILNSGRRLEMLQLQVWWLWYYLTVLIPA
jgi:hypothetical protein